MARTKVSKTPIEAPNYTQLPNVYLDTILPKVTSMAELKVTLVIMRETFGWHRKQSKPLSLSRLEVLTGLHRETVLEGLKAGMERGIITRRASGRSFIYGIRITQTHLGTREDGRKIRPSVESENPTIKSRKIRPSRVGKSDRSTDPPLLKKELKETVKENDDVAALEQLGLTHGQAVNAQVLHQLSETEIEQWATWKQTLTGATKPDAVFAAMIKQQRLPPASRMAALPDKQSGLTAPEVIVPGPDGTATSRPSQDVWRAALQILAPHVQPDEYETWLKPTDLLDVTDGVAIIGTPNVFVRQALEDRYLPLLTEVVRGVIGDDVEVLVVIGS